MVDLSRTDPDNPVCCVRSTSTISLTNTYHSEYCHNVTAVEPKWLVEVAPQFFKVADANKISKRKRQEKIEPLFNKVCVDYVATDYFVLILCLQYEKPDEWRLSKVKRSARSVSQPFIFVSVSDAPPVESNIRLRIVLLVSVKHILYGVPIYRRGVIFVCLDILSNWVHFEVF
jgi:hypothetical protein